GAVAGGAVLRVLRAVGARRVTVVVDAVANVEGRARVVGADELSPDARLRPLLAEVAVGAVAGGAVLRVLRAVGARRVTIVVDAVANVEGRARVVGADENSRDARLRPLLAEVAVGAV